MSMIRRGNIANILQYISCFVELDDVVSGTERILWQFYMERLPNQNLMPPASVNLPSVSGIVE
jgi:hypothetical protein